MYKKRVLLFKQAAKGSNNQSFEPTTNEKEIMRCIKEMQYVKSKHIENILS